MSSLDRTRRSFTTIAAVGAALALAGCLRPLHGPTASGARVQDVLASIQVEPVATRELQERIGHYLRSELAFELDGSGQPRPKRYKLTLALAQQLQSPIVDTVTGRSDSATVSATVIYSLVSLEGGKVVIPPTTAVSSASYDRSVQRFATVRAARDAEIRLAKVLAEQIKTRLAATLATAS